MLIPIASADDPRIAPYRVLKDRDLDRGAGRFIVEGTIALEQLIRAQQAQEVGLVRMLGDDGERDVRAMIHALRQLPLQSTPSEIVVPGLLDGLVNVGRLAAQSLSQKPRAIARPRLAFARG